MITQLPGHLQPRARTALAKDALDIAVLLQEVLRSDQEKDRVLQFIDEDAKQFIALLREVCGYYICCLSANLAML
jgi:hypothetical protein